MNLVIESATVLIDSWKNMIDEGGGSADINITQYMRCFSGDVISRACFASNFSKGEETFSKIGLLGEALHKNILSAIPIMR